MEIGRFAPTTSGRAHPGTLLAGMLAWLDMKRLGGRFVLRLEDIDPGARDHAWQTGLMDDLDWFGLPRDEVVWQSARAEALGEGRRDPFGGRGLGLSGDLPAPAGERLAFQPGKPPGRPGGDPGGPQG